MAVRRVSMVLPSHPSVKNTTKTFSLSSFGLFVDTSRDTSLKAVTKSVPPLAFIGIESKKTKYENLGVIGEGGGEEGKYAIMIRIGQLF